MNHVVIVGAGAAGLTCALRLQELGIQSVVLESGDAVGGRIRTDRVDGFLLDRGFQVMLSAYPACRRYLDFPGLKLSAFEPGAVVHTTEGWQRVVDPRRRWSEIWSTVSSDVGTMSDKLRVLEWTWQARKTTTDFSGPTDDHSSLEHLRQKGFSEQMINRFWRPWLSGIFLESELTTSHRMLEFVFGMFARGEAVIPQAGMQAIPEQLARKLPAGTIELNQSVTAIEGSSVLLADGSRVEGDVVVLAVDASAAHRLGATKELPQWRESRCIYYAATEPPFTDALLRLNGESSGVINHLTALDQVNPACAPEGQSLIMAGIRPGDLRTEADIEHEAEKQLTEWFGEQTKSWRILRHDRVKHALPARRPLCAQSPATDRSALFRCGDYLRHPSLQGAMESGEVAAEVVADSFQRKN